MAGIESLVKGAVGTLAKDKVASYLSPSQMDFITFALNPQAYLLDKGVNAAANALGYGSQYRELKGGAQGENEYYKEVMRDSIGDMLPDTIGDFVRATPRISEADQAPAGVYTAFDPDTQTYVQYGSPNPVSTGTSGAFENTVRDTQYGTQTPGTGKAVGPLPEGNPIFESNVSNLPYEIKSTPVSGAPEGFDPALLAAVIRGTGATTTDTGTTDDLGEVSIVDQKTPSGGGDLSYTEMLDILNSSPAYGPNPNINVSSTDTSNLAPVGATYDPNLGMNVPVTENLAPEGYMFDAGSGMNEYFGGGGSKGNIEDYSYSQYRRGGQVPQGIR
jgi:hypothetical protein